MPAATSTMEAVPGLSQAISQDAQPTFPPLDDSFPATQVDSSTPPFKNEAPNPSTLESLEDAFAAFQTDSWQTESEEEKLSKLGNLIMASGKALGIFEEPEEEHGPEAQVPSPNRGPQAGNPGCRVMVPPDFDYDAWHTNVYSQEELLEWPGSLPLDAQQPPPEPVTSPPKAVPSARVKPSSNKSAKPVATPARAKPRPSAAKPVPSPIPVGKLPPNQIPEQPGKLSPGQTAEMPAVPTPSKIAEKPATPEKPIPIPTLVCQPMPDKNPEEPIPIPSPPPGKSQEEPIPIRSNTSQEPVLIPASPCKISEDPVPVPSPAGQPSKVPGPIPAHIDQPTPSKIPAPTDEGIPKALNREPDTMPVPKPTEQVPSAHDF